MMVKRYDAHANIDDFKSDWHEKKDGPVVRYDDYAALLAQRNALAAENAGLKEIIEQHAGSVAVCPNCSHEEPSETDDIVAFYRSMETPATDAFLAEVRAQGVDMAKEITVRQVCRSEMINADVSAAFSGLSEDLEVFAAQLRQEAKCLG